MTDFSALPRAKCRSCGATIHWVLTVAGKQMPIDVKPHPGGNVHRRADGRAIVSREPPAHLTLYVSHFTTCPHASVHRNAR